MTREEAEALREDPRHWTFGVIYACRDDPRLIVRNRFLMGWTWNFAHALVFPALLGCVVVALAPATSLFLLGVRNPVNFVVATTASVLVLAGFAHHIASGPR